MFGGLNSFSNWNKSKSVIYASDDSGKRWKKIIEDENESVFNKSFNDSNYIYVISEKYNSNSFNKIRSSLFQFDRSFNKKR